MMVLKAMALYGYADSSLGDQTDDHHLRRDTGFFGLFRSHGPWGVEFMMKLMEDNENWCAPI